MGIPRRSPVTSEQVDLMTEAKFDDLNLVADYILWARHEIMVHSCIYYQLCDIAIPDYTWDMLAKALAEIQENYPHVSDEVNYYSEYFEDFTGATGCHFPHYDFLTEATARCA